MRPASTLEVLDDPRRVATMMPPLRRRILSCLGEPDSAAGLARRLGVPRQRINYHVRRLEDSGLVECVGTRRRRGCVERLLRPAARSFVISPSVLEGLSADPDQVVDRFSSSYLMAAASRTVEDVGTLRSRARAAGKKLTTLTMQTEIRFASPAALDAFRRELESMVAGLVGRYHDPLAASGRAHRFLIAGHPVITKTDEQAEAEARRRRRPGVPPPEHGEDRDRD